jgi:hypothetical protein
VTLGRRAVSIAEETDSLNLQGGALLAVADVFHSSGRSSEGIEVAEKAAALFERKGNLIALAQARERLSAPLTA